MDGLWRDAGKMMFRLYFYCLFLIWSLFTNLPFVTVRYYLLDSSSAVWLDVFIDCALFFFFFFFSIKGFRVFGMIL